VSFPAYPQYKDSGIDGIGQIPSEWEVARMDSRCETSRELLQPQSFNDQQVFHYSIPVIQENGDGAVEDGAEISSGKLEVVKPCVLVSKLNPRKETICRAYPQSITTLASSEMVPLYPRDAEIGFIEYITRSTPFKTRLMSMVESATKSHQRVNPEAIHKARWAFPSLEEQRAIAAFLERETAKIDAAVAAQERLIALLAEKRAATISHAVTKGLDPDAPMKDSGIEWLGQIPAHWEAKRLRFLCKIETGDGDTQDAVEDGEYPFFVRSPNIETINRYSFDCEAVMTSGDGAGVGKIYHHFAGKFTAHQRVYVFHGFDGIRPRLVYHYFKSYFARVTLQGTAKSTVESLRRPLLADFWVVVPAVSEQKAVLEYCDGIDQKYDAAIGRCQDGIRLLKERRAALISAAVTGKIDVRGEVDAQEQEAA